ncbi:MAG TPA: hypothetical protein VNT99_10595 [Methylomirabilota bacterium]|nr:hypothetical protein [Methylomirabilota bacterium]
MNKARVLSALVSVYTALWFTLDGAWFFKWHGATVVLSILLVALAFSSLFFMKRTRHTIVLSAAEFSWILFNVFWIRFDLGEVKWCEPIALCFLISGLLCLAGAIGMRTLSKGPQPFDSVVFRRLKL